MIIYAVCKIGEVIKAKGTKFFNNKSSAETYLHTFDRPKAYATFTTHPKDRQGHSYGYFCLSKESIEWAERNVRNENEHEGYEYETIQWDTKIYNEYHIVEIHVEE
jgi:hypothetical protein